MQKELDKQISIKRKETHPELNSEDIKVQKTLALIIEAAEYINEVQSFKYWKIHRDIKKTAVTEEFADLIHFLVNFAYKYNIDPEITPLIVSNDINIQFQQLFIDIAEIMKEVNKENILRAFKVALGSFTMLGYDYDDLFYAYEKKNRKNYERIANNY
ncbi:Dimeric dUTPase, all-alpha-NTP-PPase (MazG) superfamily [Mycoplasmopsis verecunda]|uniref:Dimeric dUTPase, all-alpha-NTP-PPase (MazG) superfamily n=2 Tax=Mycoplasmopsis verecunda TaxID=171291 RepID=A0A1T4MJ51_9BACT|nr:Dimeric dUTPase, all-alpha-NTP-PPase (MazG) superfamily [Mycoplasmopsis verecunda]